MKLLEYWWPKDYEFKVFWGDGTISYINYYKT